MGWYLRVFAGCVRKFSRSIAILSVSFVGSFELLLLQTLIAAMLKKTSISVPFGVAAALCLAVSLTAGCRGSAYRDVYQQKMASEIRVLEDQLYEADYQNQILQDQVLRAEVNAAQIVVPENRPKRSLFGKTLSDSGEVIDAPGSTNSQTPAAPRLVPPELPAGRQTAPTPAPVPKQPAPKLPARPLDSPKTDGSFMPPSEPIPPGAAELTVPDVQLGDPVPPPELQMVPDSIPDSLPNLIPEVPPGQIRLPESVKILGAGPPAEPVAIRINSGLSGGHKSDDSPSTEGISLFVEAIDEKGSVVSLDQFEIDANLSVVLLDPAQPGATAKLGNWEFGPEQIHEMLRPGIAVGRGGAGINVVIPWGDQWPKSPTVIAHVRLSAGDVAMQTQAEIATAQPAMAQWTPRATRIR